jgi:AraC-like DNA-binding protein
MRRVRGPEKKVSDTVDPLLWTRADIRFDGTELLGSKPTRDALVGLEARKSIPASTNAPRQRATGDNYTVAELAQEWGLSSDKIRELFKDEPGVLKLRDENAGRKRKRKYVTLRIPPDVARRVARRIS